MKVLLRWDDEHLRLATAHLNSNNALLEAPLSQSMMEKLIITTFSSPDTLDGLSTTIYGVMFTPELVPYDAGESEAGEEYLVIFLHISVPVIYEFTSDVREVILFDVPDFDDDIKLH